MGVAEDFAPSFTQKPQLRQEDEGNRLVFECKVLCSPKPEVTWFRSETKLIEDNRTSIKVQTIGTNLYSVVLELDDVIESDAGLYKVKAKNKLGEVAASINLNFSPVDEPRERQIDGIAPTFSKKPTIRQEEDGKRLLFECRIQADPRPTVVWSHGGVPVTDDARHKLRVENDGHSYFATLEIENVTVEDAGKYKVMAKNELGESNATISLNFDSDEAPVPESGIKPTFTEKPVIRQTDEGGDITIECRLVGEPKPSITWYHGNKVIKETLHTQTYLELDQKLYYLAKLLIKSPAMDDVGVYKVKAFNKLGDASATVNLNFESAQKLKIVDAKAPRFPKKPTIHQEGDVLVMECLLEANPVPEIIWYQGDKVILDSNRIRMSKKATGKDQYLLKLEISKPTPQDGGNYRCNACNIYGESNANIALNFQGGDEGAGFAPSFIEKPRIIPNETGTLISMKCTCTAKPKPSVTWVKGTKNIQEGARFKTKIEETKEDTYVITLEIQDPIGPDSGTYRCHVQNEYGESNANLNLNIEAETEPEGIAPTFVEKPKIRSESGGKLVVMDFKVKADPKPDIVWYHEGKVLKETSRLSWSMQEKDNSYYIRLELKDPGIQDSGIYKCNIKNLCGELNANLTLNIEIIPVIKEVPKTVTITKTNTIVIEARVQSVFEPKCTWLKGSSILKQDSRHKVEIHHVKEGEYAVKLEINPCNPNDKGAYKLVAKNEKGEATSSIIDVILPPTVEAPVISQGLNDASAVEGQPLKFICRFATLDKSLKITWTKNNRVITSSESIDIKFDGQTAILSILECKREHEGVYKISASNTAGVSESSAKLTVTEKFKQLPKIMDIVGSLPAELSHEIFKYLSPFDLGACCSVSKIWRYYANDDMLWRKICQRQRVSIPIELPPEDGDLDPLSPWALAFASYSLRKLNNWREDRKSVHIIATLDNTVVAVFETMLAYTDELGVVFVYDLSDRTRFVQTIDLIIEEPVTALGLTKDRLVVRQGDVFTIFVKQKGFVLEGFLVPHEGSCLFTRQYYLSEFAFVRHAMIEDAICILYENSLFIYSLHYSAMHTFKVDSLTFLLHDHHRVYVGTGKHTITGFNSNGSYIDLDLAPSSVVSIKSNQDLIVALVCEDYNSGRYYIFKVWSRKFPFSQFHTSRPFGLEVAGHGSRFASVANDKFGQRVCVSIFDLEDKSKYDLDLNAPDPIAQAKIQFLGRDLLYVVTRRDWGPYDLGYLIDLKTMETLYEIDMDHNSIVSIDSSLAVYMNSEAIEIHFYNR